MPFNVWCDHCQQHIARGVRFNAEKKAVDQYYSTTIWSFRMKCHLCGGWMELRTDPKNAEYVCVEGVKRKTEGGEEDGEGRVTGIGLTEEERKELMTSNPFFRIEHKTMDQRKARELIPKLGAIQATSSQVWGRDWEASRQLRKRFREEKLGERDEKRREEALKAKLAVELPLKRERDEDKSLAKNIIAGQRQRDRVAQQVQHLKRESIFTPSRQNRAHPK